jgi:hypothetical protein
MIEGIVIGSDTSFNVTPWSKTEIAQEITIRLKEKFNFNQYERVVINVIRDQKSQELTKFQILQE